jgi:hypothetical protein
MSALLNSIIIKILRVLAQSTPLPSFSPRVAATLGNTHEVTCLVAVDGEVWAGTLGGGLIRLASDGPATLDAAMGLPGNRVNGCAVSDGAVWAATDSGLAVWERDSERFETVAWGRFLKVAARDRLVVAARGDGTLLLFGRDDNPHEPERKRTGVVALSLAMGSQGQWAVGGVDGRVCISSAAKCWSLGAPVASLVYAEGGLVALTAGGGFRLDGSRFVRDETLNDAQVLAADGTPVAAAGLDEYRVIAALLHGGRWHVGTDEGLFVGDGPCAEAGPELSPESVGPCDGWQRVALGGCPCGPRIAALTVFRGELWVGGFDNGLCRFDGKRWRRYAGPEHLPSDMINHLTATSRRLYVGTLKGLAVVDRRGNFTQYTRDMCEDNPKANCPWHLSVTGVATDSVDGKVWIADTGAVHRWSSRRWRHYYKYSGIKSDKVTRVAVHDGKVAVGTGDMGLHLRESGRKWTTHDDQSGLADNWVMDLIYDRSGALWVATCTKGVSRFADGQWRTWTTREGLGDDYILSVSDIDGRIWVGHFHGISILSERGVVNIGMRDGLAGGEVHDVVKYKGRVYLATDGGLTVVDVS